MTAGNIDYEAVLSDLLARKAQLETMIAGVEAMLGSGGSMPTATPGTGGVVSLDRIPNHAFLTLSIGDATKKLLDMVKSKLTLPQIMQALEKGGLPPSKYNTVYAVLRRREGQVGDILRMGEEWGLTEWYPNNPNLRKRTPDKGKSKKSKKKSKKKTAKSAPPAGAGSSSDATMTKADAAEQVLLKVDGSLHAKVIAERIVKDYGKNATSQSVAAALFQDPKKRFKNVGENTWELIKK